MNAVLGLGARQKRAGKQFLDFTGRGKSFFVIVATETRKLS